MPSLYGAVNIDYNAKMSELIKMCDIEASQLSLWHVIVVIILCNIPGSQYVCVSVSFN